MFEIINETNEEIKEIKDVEGFLTFAIKKLKLKNVVFDIIITNNEEVRKLNREYRGIDNYTDVISFALEDYEDIKTDVRLLGDIYISLDKIKEQGINYKGCTLKASSSVPVLEQHKYLSLIKPFDIFEFALTMIVSLEDWRYIDELVDLTAQYYKEEDIPFCLELFKKPIYNINGFIAAKYGGELLISFFALDDEERDENFRDID